MASSYLNGGICLYDSFPFDKMCPNLEEQLALLYRDLDSSITNGGLKIHLQLYIVQDIYVYVYTYINPFVIDF